jgi:hypothetical protein
LYEKGARKILSKLTPDQGLGQGQGQGFKTSHPAGPGRENLKKGFRQFGQL